MDPEPFQILSKVFEEGIWLEIQVADKISFYFN